MDHYTPTFSRICFNISRTSLSHLHSLRSYLHFHQLFLLICNVSPAVPGWAVSVNVSAVPHVDMLLSPILMPFLKKKNKKKPVPVIYTFSEFIFHMFFSHWGLVNNFGHPFPFDLPSSCLVFFCILTICLSDVLHTAFPQAPVPVSFLKDFYFDKIFSTLGKGEPCCVFLKITQSCWWAAGDAENLTVYTCVLRGHGHACVGQLRVKTHDSGTWEHPPPRLTLVPKHFVSAFM